jgi:hypothetical protein
MAQHKCLSLDLPDTAMESGTSAYTPDTLSVALMIKS